MLILFNSICTFVSYPFYNVRYERLRDLGGCLDLSLSQEEVFISSLSTDLFMAYER